ncbi:hypothetical protein [Veillonella sp.]|uniref:hypothetical protein n=1 Tax=Veillonella sp. TaxID=1926307 RepID=UPI0025D7A20F|nr:hypothetical protein [Veillonella sp.]
MIGQKIYKTDLSNYTEVAQWCNANNATIVDREDYYEVVPVVHIETLADQEGELFAKIEVLKSAYAGAMLMGNDVTELEASFKELTAKLAEIQAKERKDN